MIESYSKRDSVGYLRLFDKVDYKGESYNPNDPINTKTEFRWPDEQRHIQVLAEKATITSVFLDFGNNLDPYTDIGDPAGWLTIQTNVARLEIHDGDDIYNLFSNDLNVFKFRPDPLSNPVTWKVVRWTETHE